MNSLCLYHGTCFDGFGAAWAIRRHDPTIEFVAAKYSEPPPDCTGRDVIMADFCYKVPEMLVIAAQADNLLVLDHHVSAMKDMFDVAHLFPTSTRFEFDMERSGAGIAWDFFHGMTRPRLIDYIEDRDLWHFALPDSREVHGGLATYPFDFAVWDGLMDGGLATIHTLAEMGVVLERKQQADLDTLIPMTKRRMIIGGYIVPVANLPVTMVSDAGNVMCENEPFAACYSDSEKGRHFSLRSNAKGVDVSKVAQKYGGGGHTRAAGFVAPHGWEGDDIAVTYAKMEPA